MQLELNTDFCNEFFHTLTAAESWNGVCLKNGRFSYRRSKRKGGGVPSSTRGIQEGPFL
jgi:hypothetical protein